MVRQAALAALVLGAAGALELRPDNLRTRFRENPDAFLQPWPSPRLQRGAEPKAASDTDSALHATEESGVPAWVASLYPWPEELSFAGAALSAKCRQVWWISYVASSLYLVGLWCGTAWMKGRAAYDLHTPLALWNLLLAAFSFVGMLRTVPHLLLMLWSYGFDYTVCRAALVSYGSGASGLWVAAFIFSKYVELIDTVFLVLRKRKVSFLHWYHHCSVLLYCWHAYVWEMPTGIYFVAMNYTVHAVMYFYYFLAAVCAKPPKWALMVTIMQLVQMAVGIVITLSHLQILFTGRVANCDGHVPNLAAALGMYASYFILFAQFLFQRYCGRAAPKPGKKVE